MSNFIAWALAYTARGWKVFPIRPREKAPLTRNGFKAATTDERVIVQWWQTWPDANIGIATGQASELAVLDIDGPDGARNFIALANGLQVPAAPRVKTAKGWHFYFSVEVGARVKSCVGKDGVKGVDMRADGGYVLAPPSVHPSGWVYRWDD